MTNKLKNTSKLITIIALLAILLCSVVATTFATAEEQQEPVLGYSRVIANNLLYLDYTIEESGEINYSIKDNIGTFITQDEFNDKIKNVDCFVMFGYNGGGAYNHICYIYIPNSLDFIEKLEIKVKLNNATYIASITDKNEPYVILETESLIFMAESFEDGAIIGISKTDLEIDNPYFNKIELLEIKVDDVVLLAERVDEPDEPTTPVVPDDNNNNNGNNNNTITKATLKQDFVHFFKGDFDLIHWVSWLVIIPCGFIAFMLLIGAIVTTLALFPQKPKKRKRI